MQRSESRPVEKVTTLLPRLADQYRELVINLESDLSARSIPRARAELRKLLGDIEVTATEDQILFANEKGRMEAALIGRHSQQILMVAGAGFETYFLPRVARN